MQNKKYYVYILKSSETEKLYVGHTNNLDRRIKQHNTGQSKYTRNKGYWKLLYYEEHNTRSEAMKRERFLKSVSGSRVKKQLAGII